VTLANKLSDFPPIGAGIGDQRNPALIADVRRFEIAGIFDQQLLQRQRGFEADAKVAFVFLQHRESFFAGLEGGMAPGSDFSSVG
jgi:hypothetical protein